MRLPTAALFVSLQLATAGCGLGKCASTPQACFSVDSSNNGQCSFHNGTDESTCSSSQTSGHCPSDNLIGCCVTSDTVLGCTSQEGACYYQGSANAQSAQANCNNNVGGATQSWVTTPP